jgi:hypothetical protein
LLSKIVLRLITIVFGAAGLFSAVHGKNDSVIYRAASFFCDFPHKRVEVMKSVYEKPGLNFLVLHDDENTGLEAAHDFCSVHGGSITELRYGDERNVAFGTEKVRFSFDPNQIFNNAGALKTLRKYSISKPPPSAVEKIRTLAISIINKYNPDSMGYIITLHNNTEGKFNINSYIQDKLLISAADSVYVNSEMDLDDFILVTEPVFFSYLKSKAINTVLQSKKAADGSLSVYAQANKIPYLNIEVQDGHKDEHLHLIQIVDRMFREIGYRNLYGKSR